MFDRAFDHDVFVIGGGPAGLACAIAARREGFRVALADGRKPPIDKACGEGLMPGAVEAAGQMGIALSSVESFPFRGIRFKAGNSSVDASFPSGKGLSIRRTVLHRALAEEAARAGADLHWGTVVSGIDGNRVHMTGRSVRARWIIGADGANSRVRKWADLERGHASRRFGFRRHYEIAPWADCVEVYWGDGFQLYVSPTASAEVGVALISRDPHVCIDRALLQFPELRSRLASARVITADRGAASFSRRLDAIHRGPVILLGDAAGSVDAVTGEGICLAFRQAQLLADSLVHGDLSRYRAGHARLMRRPRWMSALLLSMDRWPCLRTRAIETMAAKPDLFAGMLAAHVGSARLTDLAAAGLALGLEML